MRTVLLSTFLLAGVFVGAAEPTGTLRLHSGSRPVFDRTRLLGTNLALWHEPDQLEDVTVKTGLKELAPAFLRIPGGSWSDEIYWNGNGVRAGEQFDLSKRSGAQWKIDYSGYAPGFRLASTDGALADFHGHVDVKTLHDYVKEEGAHAVVTVNAGTGTPEMAAEWVRWANHTQGYGVRYWEIGNELEGAWEMGHFLPDGSKMTGEIYAKRFLEFARAMKAVDPDIKIGGPTASNLQAVFLEDFLRIAGAEVDFVSVHTYPVGNGHGDPEAFFAALNQLETAVRRYRELFRTYQPDRADDLEIAITEWNSKVFEDRDTGDLLNGLWTAAWVGEMFEHGVSFAAQWDLLTRTPEGGHGMFALQEGTWVPASQYWGLQLWSKHMGNHWVDSETRHPGELRSYVTRSADRLHVMVVNPSRENPARLQLESETIAFKLSGRAVTLSHRNYVWDPFTHQPARSLPPQIEPYDLENGILEVPPHSVRIFEFPFTGELNMDPSPPVAEQSGLRLLLPAEHPADLPLEGWVLAGSGWEDAPLQLEVQGAATVLHPPVLREGAGQFFLQPSAAGEVVISVGTVTRRVQVLPVQEREQVVWDFEDPTSDWGMRSAFPLTADANIRPNQQVARITLNQVKPEKGHDHLLLIEPLSEELPLERINGVRMDLQIATGLITADPDTHVQVVLQSHGDHWMVLGTVPLKDLEGKWNTLRFPLRGPEDIRVAGSSYALRLQLLQKNKIKQPVTGILLIDNLGFIYR